MSKIFTILLLIFSGISGFSQSISFEYDNAGNRIKRYNITTPDLRPYLIMPNVTFQNSEQTRAFTTKIRNVRPATTATEMITLRLYKPTISATIALTGASATDWSITSTSTYYLLTTNVDISSLTPYDITATLTIPASSASGVYNFGVLIPDLSGGEAIVDNTNNGVVISVSKQ